MRELLSAPWVWGLLGLILMGAEILVPGIYLLFVGASALVIAAIFWVMPGFSIWLAGVIFIVLVVAGILLGRRLSRTHDGQQAQELNDRASLLIGAKAVLVRIKSPGLGTVRVGDTAWRARWGGADPQDGAVLKIIDVQSATLIVQPAEDQ